MISSIYTWNTAKGSLSLYNEGGQHILRLSTRDAQIVDISDITLDGDLFETPPEKIGEVCKQYLPVIKKDGSTGAFSVTFHVSTTPGTTSAYEPNSGNGAKTFGFDFNKMETSFFIQFDDKAPDYRRVVRGLNLEGKCQEASCDAHKKTVCIPVGMVKEFNIGKAVTQSSCPACDTKLDASTVKNLGFWDCKYTIDGNREREDVKKTDTAPADKYKTFAPGDTAVWTYLEITTESIGAGQQAAGSGGRGCVIL